MKAIIVDGQNYLHRAYYAGAPMTTRSGFPTNALRVMLTMVISDLKRHPKYYAVAFDEKKDGVRNWRQKLYPAYKLGEERQKLREAVGDQIKQQYPVIKSLLKASGICVLAQAGEEADDIIGTLAEKFREAKIPTVIASTDKDFAQLVDKYVCLMGRDHKQMGTSEIVEKYGVKPRQIVSMLQLVGDKVDNIPGVHQVGTAIAAKLLSKYKSVSNVVEHADELSPAIARNLKEVAPVFPMTRKLLTIKRDLDIGISVKDCVLAEPDWERLERLCRKYELRETWLELKSILEEIHGTGIKHKPGRPRI